MEVMLDLKEVEVKHPHNHDHDKRGMASLMRKASQLKRLTRRSVDDDDGRNRVK